MVSGDGGERESWSSRAGFILAAIGSAVGIGNIWRFSSVVGQNGGGAYLVPYLVAVFLFAYPLMLLEFGMGRHFTRTVVGAFGSVGPRFRTAGWFLAATIFLVLCYYLVITGWTAAYAAFSLAGAPVTFRDFTGSYLPVASFLFSAAVTVAVVSLGVRKGIERVSVVLIPISAGILTVMALYAVTLPGFPAGIHFLFSPDFSVLSDPLVWSAAFGQAFFSLSVGTGILLTYGAYMERETPIPSSALAVTVADLGIALLAGVVIFPIVFTFGLEPAAGAELAFVTLPAAFAMMPAGRLFATAFFLLLFFAAITSAVSMLEVGVSSLSEATGWSRQKTSLVLGAVMVALGLPAALSYSAARWTIGGVAVLDAMDETVGTLGLPVAGVVLALVFSWLVPRDVLEREVGRLPGRIVHAMCRVFIPAVLLFATGARLASGIDPADFRLLTGSPWIGSALQVGAMAGIAVALLVAISLLCRFGRCPLGRRLMRGR